MLNASPEIMNFAIGRLLCNTDHPKNPKAISEAYVNLFLYSKHFIQEHGNVLSIRLLNLLIVW